MNRLLSLPLFITRHCHTWPVQRERDRAILHCYSSPHLARMCARECASWGFSGNNGHHQEHTHKSWWLLWLASWWVHSFKSCPPLSKFFVTASSPFTFFSPLTAVIHEEGKEEEEEETRRWTRRRSKRMARKIRVSESEASKMCPLYSLRWKRVKVYETTAKVSSHSIQFTLLSLDVIGHLWRWSSHHEITSQSTGCLCVGTRKRKKRFTFNWMSSIHCHRRPCIQLYFKLTVVTQLTCSLKDAQIRHTVGGKSTWHSSETRFHLIMCCFTRASCRSSEKRERKRSKHVVLKNSAISWVIARQERWIMLIVKRVTRASRSQSSVLE